MEDPRLLVWHVYVKPTHCSRWAVDAATGQFRFESAVKLTLCWLHIPVGLLLLDAFPSRYR